MTLPTSEQHVNNARPYLATLTCALLLGACADAPTAVSPSPIDLPVTAAPTCASVTRRQASTLIATSSP